MTSARPGVSIPRYYSLDGLRAAMMMLGVVRHAAMSYEPTVVDAWPYQDAQADILAHWVIVFIRMFQLPVFFAIAGFFAAYLVEARGIRTFLRHRWSRIGVPFLAVWPLLAVTMYLVVVPFAARFSSVPPNIAYDLADLMQPRSIDYLFLHLWFLYDLMVLCVVASAVRLLSLRIPEKVRARALDLFERFVHRGGIAVLVVVAGVILFRMRSWNIEFYAGPLPPPRLLGLFGLFFAFGWLLFSRRETLEGFKRPAWVFLAVGTICFFAHRHFVDTGCHPDHLGTCTGPSGLHHLGAAIFHSLSTWTLTYGLFGLFLRYMDRPSPRWRYLADASYWIYIVHLPVVMLLPLLLANVPLPGIVKLALVVITATCMLLLAYRYVVRPTFIGKQLNGRRYPRTST